LEAQGRQWRPKFSERVTMANGDKIRVLVADDSAFMRKVMLSIIDSDGSFEVVGEARDGRDTVEKSLLLRPDVITMDINMPHMDGLQATEIIMSTEPRPIVIVSVESRDGAASTLRALEMGAVDFVAKPTGGVDLDMSSVRDELIRKLRTASKVRVIRNLMRSPQPKAAAPPRSGEPAASMPISTPAPNGGRFPIAVLAASTGGPATLMKLVPQFPATFAGALLIIQHMPGAFTQQFAQQLSTVSRLPVKQAVHNEMMRAGHVYVCPGDCHLRVAPPARIILDHGPRIAGYRPSIDVTLESVAVLAGSAAAVAVLTGMGNDGSRGVLAVQENGGLVLAQDEASSVIFGMPQEAIKSGAVEQVLPLDQIAGAISRRLSVFPRAAKSGE